MSRRYVLVDFENVQPSSLGALKAGDCHVMVFAGQHQTRVDLGLAQALQPFGMHAQYIQIVGSGKDALDFHIAFYIGRLSAEHPGSSFTIVSKDTGFDPLVKHLAKLGIECRQVGTIGGASVELPRRAVKKAAATKKVAKATKAVVHPRLQDVIERLASMKKARPGTLKTLRSTIAKAFVPAIADADIDVLVEALRQRKVLSVEGTKIVYPA